MTSSIQKDALVQEVTPAPGEMPRRRCIVYIDGFNLYYGVLEPNPQWKWLDIQRLFESLRIDEDVIQIKYFTAEIDPELRVSDRRDRQKRYFKALLSLAKVKLIRGKYQLRSVKCRAACKQPYQTPEEKKTDVNIAVNLLDDAHHGRVDSVVLVSGDSDIEPAVEWIRKNMKEIKVTVYIPVLPDEAKMRRNDFYKSIGATCRELPLKELPLFQLPDPVMLPNGTAVDKPKEWK